MSSAAQLAANQKNAQLSTGPTSPEGKANSSKNALKTGLTGRTVLLPTDDAELYQKHLDSFSARYQPVGDEELELVQSMADAAWRLARIPSLEAGIYAVGRLKLADLFPNEEPAMRRQLIDAQIFLAYHRQLNNLSVQESRLLRQLEKDTAALKQIQEPRKQQRSTRLSAAAGEFIHAYRSNPVAKIDPSQFGFEFTAAEIRERALVMQPELFARKAA